jgi:hypothetical protein
MYDEKGTMFDPDCDPTAFDPEPEIGPDGHPSKEEEDKGEWDDFVDDEEDVPDDLLEDDLEDE